MYFKRKYFIFFIVLLVALMGMASAADTDDSIETVTSDISTGGMAADTPESIEVKNINFEDTVNPEDYNVAPNNENNNIKSRNNSLNNKESNDNFETDTNLLQKKSTDKVKTQSNENVTTITEDNYNDYISINSEGKVTLKQAYFVPGNNYTINFTYLPAEAKQLATNNFYNNKYKNDSIKIAGTINDVSMVVGGGSLKLLILEDLTINYNPDFTGDYVDVTSQSILNRVNINVDTQRNGSSVPLRITGNNTVVENCTINARLPSTQIDWDSTSIPYGIGVFINAYNVTFANNVVDIEESAILTSTGSHRSLYGMLIGGRYHRLHNNTLYIQGSQYTYAIVLRSSCNNITNNNITAISEYYTAGINIEGNAIVNNTVCNNYFNVVAGYDVTDNGNPDVAYACLILDYTCGGQYYVATSRSMYNNNYTNNTVICEGRQVYGFEIWGGVNATINDNNITATGTLPMAIGAIGINTTMNNNTINIYGKSNSTEGSADYIKPRTAGIYAYGMKEGNTITNNIIFSENGRALLFEEAENVQVENNFLLTEKYAYVIEVDSKNNTFQNNAIVGEGTVDEVIRDKTDNENIYINNREPTKSTLTISAPDEISLDEEINITVTLKDEEENSIPNQYVKVYLGDGDVQTLLTDKEGKCVISYTMTTKNVQVNAEYECYQDYGCNATKVISTIKPIILTPENFDTYITGGLLNDNVPNGSYIDVSGRFDGERYAFNITKPVNIYSSNHDAFFSFYSSATSESGSELPRNSFVVAAGGSGTNVTGIYFDNTEILVLYAHDVILDNLTVYCTEGYGWGRGSTSIRNSNHVTIRNSYFNTTDDNGVSTVVFAASQDSLIENCTVTGSGFIGNLVYATTYNVDVQAQFGNNNITIRDNRIIARNLSPGIATCYSVCLIGDNLTVENNYIENSNNYLIMTQYKDDAYEVEGDTGSLIIRNNSFATGKIDIKFDPCTIEDNTFYGNVTLLVTNNTVTNNNRNMDASENPYIVFDDYQKPLTITIDGPNTYIFDDTVTVKVNVVDTLTKTPVTTGYLEVYADGVLYKNITVNSAQTTFTYANESFGLHHLRVWYCNGEVSFIQENLTLESVPISGQLVLDSIPAPHIGDNVTLRVTFALNKNATLDNVNITFSLPGQNPITVAAKDNSASITTVITTDYIKKIGSVVKEQNIKITATTGTDKIVISGINTKLGVQKAIPEITVTPTTSKVQNSTTFTAKITTNGNMPVTGKIVFTDQDGNKLGEKTISDNTATIALTFDEAGNKQITATYEGTAHFEAAQTTVTVKVEKYRTKITLNMPNTINRTQSFTISGKLTDELNNELPNKKLTVGYDSKVMELTTDANGNYQTTISDLTRSTTVKVTYAGSATEDSISTAKSITVKETPTLTVKLSSSKVYTGSKVTVTVTLKDMDAKAIANQNVTVKIGSTSYNQKTNNNGTISISYTTSTTGTVAVNSKYNGNSQYNTASATSSFTVQPKVKTTITTSYNTDTIIGNTEKITFTLKDANNKAVANQNINITIENNKYTQKTNTNGTITIAYKITGTNTKITATYTGNTQYLNTSTTKTMTSQKRNTTITLSVNNTKAYITDTVKATITLKDYTGTLLKNQDITVQIGSNSYNKKTNSKGTVTLTYKATASTKITIKYTGDTTYQAKSLTKTYKASKKNTQLTFNTIKTTMYKDNVTITGKLTDKNANIIKQAKVQLKINKKTVTVKTNSKGIFTYTTKTTQTGKNTVTVTYNGDTTYNKATLNTKFTVTKRTTKMTVSKIANVKSGKKVKITGKLTDKTGTQLRNCKIIIKLDGKTVTVKTNSKGIYSYTYTTKTKGTKKVQINYKGNTNYKATSKTTTFKVTA